MKKNPNYKWAQCGHEIWKVLRTHFWTKLTFSVLTNIQCCIKPWDCPSPTHHCLWAAAAVLACRPFAALSAALAPLQLPGSKKTCSRVSTWDWWGSRDAYLYLFPLHTALCPLLPFLLLPSLTSCSPASPSSLMSMFSINLTSNGGWGLRGSLLSPLMGDFSSASGTQWWPQATVWETEASPGNLPSSNRNVLKSTWMRPDKDSLLNQTLVRFLHLLPGPSAHFFVKSSFSKTPAKSV